MPSVPGTPTPAGSSGGVGLLVSKQFYSHARIMNGKGQAKPLVGGTNWTACVVREITLFVKQLQLRFVIGGGSNMTPGELINGSWVSRLEGI
eukprot:466259-Pyramimonas_sp.AAC.1